jgi:hypothetical protein
MAARIAITIVKITARTIGLNGGGTLNFITPIVLAVIFTIVIAILAAMIKPDDFTQDDCPNKSYEVFHTDDLHYLYTFILK